MQHHRFHSSLSISRASVSHAFTLLELLIVIAIIGLMAVVVLPAISSLSTGRASENNLYELSRALELARSEALAGSTYTWLALMNTTNTEGRAGLSFSLFASRDGSASTGANNLSPLTRPVFLPDLEVVARSSLSPEISGVPSTATDISTTSALMASNAGVDYGAGSESHTLSFSPQGEVILDASPTPASPFERWAVLPIATQRNAQRISTLDAAIVLAGGAGQVQIVRR